MNTGVSHAATKLTHRPLENTVSTAPIANHNQGSQPGTFKRLGDVDTSTFLLQVIPSFNPNYARQGHRLHL
jgi:hypothetical protein